jgi:hypothetical protein
MQIIRLTAIRLSPSRESNGDYTDGAYDAVKVVLYAVFPWVYGEEYFFKGRLMTLLQHALHLCIVRNSLSEDASFYVNLIP